MWVDQRLFDVVCWLSDPLATHHHHPHPISSGTSLPCHVRPPVYVDRLNAAWSYLFSDWKPLGLV